MHQKKSYVGPRGWAMLTLFGGTALASPFFLSPDVDVEGAVTQPAPSHAAGLARLASMELPSVGSDGLSHIGSDRSVFDLPNLAQQIVPPAGASPTELPAWAPVRSPIDDLISQGTAPAWQADSAQQSTLKPLTPWTNTSGTVQPAPLLSPPATTVARPWPDASSLPIADRRSAHSGSAAAQASGNMSPAATGPQGSLGNLTSTAQSVRTSTTPRLRPPEGSPTSPPAQRQFVYQPGFNAAARLP